MLQILLQKETDPDFYIHLFLLLTCIFFYIANLFPLCSRISSELVVLSWGIILFKNIKTLWLPSVRIIIQDSATILAAMHKTGNLLMLYGKNLEKETINAAMRFSFCSIFFILPNLQKMKGTWSFFSSSKVFNLHLVLRETCYHLDQPRLVNILLGFCL